MTRLTAARQTSLEALIQGFEDFKKTVAKDDMVVLFYAGHGMGLNDGTYLAPADVRESSLQVDATAPRRHPRQRTDRGAAAGSAGVAVIDACRNDLFSRAVRRHRQRRARPASG